eukprot:2462425-Prymnesium_polylepis.3
MPQQVQVSWVRRPLGTHFRDTRDTRQRRGEGERSNTPPWSGPAPSASTRAESTAHASGGHNPGRGSRQATTHERTRQRRPQGG